MNSFCNCIKNVAMEYKGSRKDINLELMKEKETRKTH